jgi:hypothetical protein
VRSYRFTFEDIPLACDDGTTTTTEVRGKALAPRLHGLGSFIGSGGASADVEGNRGSFFVFGVLQRPGYAVGIVKVRSSSRSDEVRCTSGRLAWSAAKAD